MIKNTKIFIAGSNGLVGSALVRQCEEKGYTNLLTPTHAELDLLDMAAVAEYFNQNVELVVLDNDNVYSKAQARQIVSNFFKNFTPKPNGFSILHQGGKEGAKYVIGNLLTTKGNFRVYFL